MNTFIKAMDISTSNFISNTMPSSSYGVGPDAVTKEFVESINQHSKIVVDEKYNESISEWGVGDQRLAMSFKLIRGLSRNALQLYVRNIVAESIKRGTDGHPMQEIQGYVDLFLLAFNTRDIDEGKGERQLFYWFIIELYKYFPQTTQRSLAMIPAKYGSWKDIKLMLEMIQQDLKGVRGAFRKSPNQDCLEKLEEDLLIMFETQLNDDMDIYNQIIRGDSSEQISLCAKWAPREGRHFSWLAKRLAIRMFRSSPDLRLDGSQKTDSVDDAEKNLLDAKTNSSQIKMMEILQKNLEMAKQSCYKRYRKHCSKINKHLNTTEILMCDEEGRWSQLVPIKIPARCLKIHRNAFMNLNKKKEERSTKADRRICAANFKNHMQETIKNPDGKAKVHGKKLHPHELVKVYFEQLSGYSYRFGSRHRSIEIDLTIEAQWAAKVLATEELGFFKKFVAVSDVSGSMSGTPMLVSIALGILISKTCHKAFRNRFLTFHENPSWHDISSCKTLLDMVKSAASASWGGTTNFEKTMNLMINTCVKHKVPASEVAELNLLVLSDMQFNQAARNGYYGGNTSVWLTKYERIKKAWSAAGYKDPMTNKPICPQITFWNLRGDTMDFPSSANTPGVTMISGFSINGLRAFMNGDDMSSLESDKKPTPYDGLRNTLDSERYDTIREMIEEVSEITSRATGDKYIAPIRIINDDEDTYVMVSPNKLSNNEKKKKC